MGVELDSAVGGELVRLVGQGQLRHHHPLHLFSVLFKYFFLYIFYTIYTPSHLVLDAPGPVVDVVALGQETEHALVPGQLDVVLGPGQSEVSIVVT